MASFFMSVMGPPFSSTLVAFVDADAPDSLVATESFDEPTFSPLAAALAAFSLLCVSYSFTGN